MTLNDISNIAAAVLIAFIVVTCAHTGLRAAVAATMVAEQARAGEIK